MKRIALTTALALAFAGPALAQDTTQTATGEEEQQAKQETTQAEQETTQAEQDSAQSQDTAQQQETAQQQAQETAQAQEEKRSTTQAQGGTAQSAAGASASMRQGRKTRGRVEGDPPIIDHSADTLIVEPPTSTITLPASTDTP